MGTRQGSEKNIRERLVEAGVRLLEQVGPEALQARKVAAEIGASTMAVYTHFGDMAGLLDAIVAEAFERFAQALAATPTTDDPVADFLVMGAAYREFALARPQRYRLMFGLAGPRVSPVSSIGSAVTGLPVGEAAFGVLVRAVERMVDTGRIRGDDALDVAGRFWSAIHGVVLLETAGYFGRDDAGAQRVLRPLFVDLLAGMGDDRQRLQRSIQAAGELKDAAESTNGGA